MDAQEVADAFTLGRAESLSEPVARGELGQVRRLVTDAGTWAVKEAFEPFDPEERIAAEASGAFHLACWEAGIPTAEPRTGNGRFVVDVDDELLQAFSWVEMRDPDPMLDPEAVGRLVAALHGVRRPAAGEVHGWFEAPIGERAWRAALKASRVAGAPYADRLAEVLPGLLAAERLLTPMARHQTCHLDLWADNLRSTPDGAPVLIDFDNAGPADPSREVAMVVFEFGQGDAARQRRLYDAYREAGGPGRITGPGDFALTIAQLHHIGQRHLTMWPAARDAEARARSQAGVEEFLGEPFLVADVERILAAVR